MRTFLFEDEPSSPTSLPVLLAQLPDDRLQDILCTYLNDPMVSRERHTDGISESAIDSALKNQGKTPTTEKVEAVQCGALDVDLKKLRRTGDLVRWYHDKHRKAPMSDETMEIRAARWRQG
ncbi:MAG: hypothetical protein AUI84_02830 [Delftia sp. 13_1_40CM_3_66_6]|nr:MAG: hypothetical protein AUI84_02830 [Delftia sp. 13_1_40CM_3_66_6]